MPNTFTNKVALVTGGTSGIGRATALEFARAGAKVVVSGRREKEGAQVVKEIEKLGGTGGFIRTDISREADVTAMVDFAVTTYGGQSSQSRDSGGLFPGARCRFR